MPKGLIEKQLQYCLKLKAECILYLVGYMNKIDFISLTHELCSWIVLLVSFMEHCYQSFWGYTVTPLVLN